MKKLPTFAVGGALCLSSLAAPAHAAAVYEEGNFSSWAHVRGQNAVTANGELRLSSPNGSASAEYTKQFTGLNPQDEYSFVASHNQPAGFYSVLETADRHHGFDGHPLTFQGPSATVVLLAYVEHASGFVVDGWTLANLSAPELDATSGALAGALTLGGLALMGERRRKVL